MAIGFNCCNSHHWISNLITNEYHCKQWIKIVVVSANGAIGAIVSIDANGDHIDRIGDFSYHLLTWCNGTSP
jgi:hypothetical protein